MAKLKRFVLQHKKGSIVAGIAALLVIAAVIVAVVLLRGGKENEDGEKKTSFKDWDHLIADLEEEPVSDLDEPYKDSAEIKGKNYKLSINKTNNYVIVYEKDSKGEYSKVVRTMLCSTGYDTPTGTFTTSDKYTWKIVNGNVWAQYATRVEGNVLLHSMPYSSKDKGALIPGYYNQLGRTLSAGSIRLSAGDARWIMKNCPKGMTVEIFESEEQPDNMPLAMKVPEDATWDPTDPDKANPWKAVTLEFQGLPDVMTVERGSQMDYLQGVTVKDTCGNDAASLVEIETAMDVFTPGSYPVKYKLTDASGKSLEKDVTFQVVDTQAPKLSGLKDTVYFSSIGSVTREAILDGVLVLDNNQVLDLNVVQVELPVLVEGVNQVGVKAVDNFGNEMITTINVIIDSNPPQVELQPGVPKKIPLTQNVDRSYALSRIKATDDGVELPESEIKVSIIPELWGYRLNYKISDNRGNVTNFQDEVTYLQYTIVTSGNLKVTDLESREQLMKGVSVKADDGTPGVTDQVKCTVKELAGGKYQVDYVYEYSCPLGSKTATASDVFVLAGTPQPSPTEEPSESESPDEGHETVGPNETEKPVDTPVP